MKITLSDVGKRFNREWIFRHVNYSFESGVQYAITGPNGSGKSTLLQVIAGAIDLSEGDVQYIMPNTQTPNDTHYKHLSFCGPYFELIEEMTLIEFLQFHFQFKALLAGFEIKKIVEVLGLEQAAYKQIRYFSSGMKQRVKLAQAIFADVPVVLLDEPCTNLDESGIAQYQQLISNYCSNRLVIVSSNDKQEYGFCKEILKIGDYK
ncbi:MAG TPA: ATP-binding cassette domain-containing protein [Chitinophagaceae bacterium]|nr:ATP-binding cassette domain-containing protein [Chitinophagaceae bacterium]